MLDNLTLAIGWTLTVLIGLFGFVILWKIVKGDIDLDRLLSEPDGSGVSFSRFQFLIFTFVISMSLFWVIVHGGGFPKEIPGGIFALLGISGGSYVISKGIQPKITELNIKKAKDEESGS